MEGLHDCGTSSHAVAHSLDDTELKVGAFLGDLFVDISVEAGKWEVSPNPTTKNSGLQQHLF